MLVNATVTETRHIKKNIELPYYSKLGDNFYRVNEDGSVLKVTIDDKACTMGLFKKRVYSEAIWFEDAVGAPECSPEEVENAAKTYLEFVGETINSLSEAV